MREIDRALIAGDADGGPVRAGHNVRPKAKRFDHTDYVVDLALAGVSCHYNEHGVKRRLLTRNYTLRSNFSFRFWTKQNGRQHALDFRPVLLVLRRQLQSLAEMFAGLVDRESRPFGRDFKKNPARLAKVDRVKIETIDHRRDV